MLLLLYYFHYYLITYTNIQATSTTTTLLIHKNNRRKCKRNTFKKDHSILLVNLISGIKASCQWWPECGDGVVLDLWEVGTFAPDVADRNKISSVSLSIFHYEISGTELYLTCYCLDAEASSHYWAMPSPFWDGMLHLALLSQTFPLHYWLLWYHRMVKWRNVWKWSCTTSLFKQCHLELLALQTTTPRLQWLSHQHMMPVVMLMTTALSSPCTTWAGTALFLISIWLPRFNKHPWKIH